MIGMDRAGRLRRAAASFLAAIAVGVLVVLAARADAAVPHGSPWLTTLDIATGLAFVTAAVVARGSSAERLLIAGVGVAWLTASFLPAARSVHTDEDAAGQVQQPTEFVADASSLLLTPQWDQPEPRVGGTLPGRQCVW
jgi:hypothetical protein